LPDQTGNDDGLMRTLFRAAGEELLAGRECREKREQRMGCVRLSTAAP
jgi:hypothetical protein